jgi:coenzyme F420-reducing hydrogenase beta subunit
MRFNDEGFLTPFVDTSKCTHCGICQRYCPKINYPSIAGRKPIAFAASSNDEEIQFQSSSGGIFSELSKHILGNNGLVFGAAFDETLSLKHISVNNERELSLLRGSKYVQSQINYEYLRVLDEQKNRPALFCGTPCQIAAISNLLGIKRTQNLFLCDVICHGVASEFFFKWYLKNLANGRMPLRYSFRDKRLGWTKFGSSAVFSDNSEYFRYHKEDMFMIGYLRNIFLRDACYSCSFAKVPRHSDITLGDFWGVPKNLYDPKGVSAVLINTSKGLELFDKLDVTKNAIAFDKVVAHNSRIINGKMVKPKLRSYYFELLKSNRLDLLSEAFRKKPSMQEKVFNALFFLKDKYSLALSRD